MGHVPELVAVVVRVVEHGGVADGGAFVFLVGREDGVAVLFAERLNHAVQVGAGEDFAVVDEQVQVWVVHGSAPGIWSTLRRLL